MTTCIYDRSNKSQIMEKTTCATNTIVNGTSPWSACSCWGHVILGLATDCTFWVQGAHALWNMGSHVSPARHQSWAASRNSPAFWWAACTSSVRKEGGGKFVKTSAVEGLCCLKARKGNLLKDTRAVHLVPDDRFQACWWAQRVLLFKYPQQYENLSVILVYMMEWDPMT